MKKELFVKIVSIICISIFMPGLILSKAVYAQDPLMKLARGISNAGLGIFELPINIQKTGEEDGFGRAVTYGLLKGAGRAFWRTILGAYETATFWIPIPGNFAPILTNPEFIFEKEKE